MLRVIAVDDEKNALERFDRVMVDEPRVSVVGRFSHADEALDFIRREPVDVAFLDVEMPGIDGLQIAEIISQETPNVEIVFITAYEKYALKAFKAHAVGFLLKPLDIREVREQIDTLVGKISRRSASVGNARLSVHCFGSFSCYPESSPDEPVRWRTSKAEELFALLVHVRGRAISREMLIDALWPEVEPDKGANQFRVTCTYIRNTLAEIGFPEMLLRDRDSYFLDSDKLNCDTYTFSSIIGSLSITKPDVAAWEKAAALYTGRYFSDKAYEWTLNTSTRLENDFKTLIYRLATEYMKTGDQKAACSAIARILEQDPYEEEAVEKLMSLLLYSGENAAAARVYREYEEKLKAELDIAPSDDLKLLFDKIF